MSHAVTMLGMECAGDAMSGAGSQNTHCGTSRTVLVADCDKAHRAIVAEMLESQGYKVVLASDGDEALARVEAGGLDLLITAMSLPRMSGLELLQAARDGNGVLPVIVIATGMTEMDGVYLKAAEAMGAAHGYIRPLTPSVFFRDIYNILRVPGL